MRIVITGATGNLGTALLRRLADDGGHELVGIARRAPDPVAPYTGVQWERLDIAAPDATGRLRGMFAGADAVVHLAWGFQPTHDPDRLEAVGVGGTRAVLAASTAVAVPHLVHMSSVGTYRAKEDDEPVDETWPHDGVASSVYSCHKATAERLLDVHDASGVLPRVARVRPGFVVQRDAGSALLRYGLPGYLPAAVLRHLPVLPLDGRLTIPLVHADDVASAVVAVLRYQATGAFNVAAPPPVQRADIATALGAHPLQVPAALLRALVDVTWRLHLQGLDAGWVDLAFAVPLMSTARARAELGWEPAVDARDALAEVVDGMADATAGASPVLRARSVLGTLTDLLSRGRKSTRELT